jgi:DAK2 domain fusion protein YloV
MIRMAYFYLDRNQEAINALNVFPVPDGDTGTNMLLTVKSAWEEIADSDEKVIGRLAKSIARGALMGARGNSGVILSQILRGFAQALDDKAICDAETCAAAFAAGKEMAYRGVKRPVEGTILTVMRFAADAAEKAARESKDVLYILSKAVAAARKAEEETPRLLNVLAQAGVTDSGGEGLCVFLEGMLAVLRGETVEEVPTEAAVVPEAPARPHASKGNRPIPPVKYGFDVQFLIEGENLDVEEIRRTISAMGDYPLVEGDDRLVKVHVHVFDPSVPLAYAVRTGFVTDVVVENMDDMAAQGMVPPDVAEVVEGTKAPPLHQSPAVSLPQPMHQEEDKLPVIVVAPGDGFAEVFRSLGAYRIIKGGQTMNPSIQELLEAIESVPGDEVIILPNNSNVIMAAEQARQIADKKVYVIPSKTVPQGISALLSVMHNQDVAANAAQMERSLHDVKTGEVTIAVRNARFDGIEVSKGEPIGLLDGRLAVKGESTEEVVLKLLEKMDAEEGEILTIYCGENVPRERAEALSEIVQEKYPDLEVELVRGGQPHYHYIFSVE